MIRRTPNGYYVASSKQVWKAGIYDSERAARYCFQFPDSELKALQEQKNKANAVITFEDLQELRKLGKIITRYSPAPIPIRHYDWSAVREDSEDEDCIVGYGETEQEAIQDLLDKESL